MSRPAQGSLTAAEKTRRATAEQHPVRPIHTHRRIKTSTDTVAPRRRSPAAAPVHPHQPLNHRGVVFPDKILRFACTPEERAQFSAPFSPSPPHPKQHQQPPQPQQRYKPTKPANLAIRPPVYSQTSTSHKPRGQRSTARDGATSRLQRSRSFDSFHHPEDFLRSATVSPLSRVCSRPSSNVSSVSLQDSFLTDSTFNIAAAMSSSREHQGSSSRRQHHHHQSMQHESVPKWSARKSSLDEFRARVLHTDRKPSDDTRPRSARRPSFRRALSIINDVPPLPSQGPHSPMATEAPRRKSFSRKRSSAQAPTPESLGPSQYYQDPEARMKLKLLLSSAQDFEEVIEHGFPTTPSSPTALNFSRPRGAAASAKPTGLPTAVRANNDAQRFLRNEVLSLFDDGESFNLERDVMAAADEAAHDEDDDTSLGDLDSPITPHDAESLRPLQVRHEHTGNPTFFFPESISSGHLSKPSIVRHSGEAPFDLPSGAPWPPREMTLRMTLTKPELRAPAEAIYGVQGSDPLALDDLPQLEDHAAFRRENKGMKFWRKMKK